MIRKTRSATLDVGGYIFSDPVNQFHDNSLLTFVLCCTSWILRVNVRQPPSHIELLMGCRNCVASRMARDICMAQIACRFAAANVFVITIQEIASIFLEMINEK